VEENQGSEGMAGGAGQLLNFQANAANQEGVHPGDITGWAGGPGLHLPIPLEAPLS